MTVWNTNDDRYYHFGHFYEKNIFENVEKSLYSQGFVIRTMWNTNDVIYSDFENVEEPLYRNVPHFLLLPNLKMWKRLYIDLYFLILPFFYFLFIFILLFFFFFFFFF